MADLGGGIAPPPGRGFDSLCIYSASVHRPAARTSLKLARLATWVLPVFQSVLR